MYGGLEVWRCVVGIATCMYGGMEVGMVLQMLRACMYGCIGGLEVCCRYSDVYVWTYGGGNGVADVASVYVWDVWRSGGLEVCCRCCDVYVWTYGPLGN